MSDLDHSNEVHGEQTPSPSSRFAQRYAKAEAMRPLIDQMVDAALSDSWESIGPLGEQLQQKSKELGFRAISVMARQVTEEAHKPDNKHRVRRSMIRLLGYYGYVDQPETIRPPRARRG